MAFGRINLKELRREIIESGAIDHEMVELVQERFEEEKELMLAEFDTDDVTEEILGGPTADNITNTLKDASGQKNGEGNLCAFLGFDNGNEDEVIRELREILELETTMNTTPVIRQNSNIISYRFTGRVPTSQEIYQQTPVNWGKTARGRSWVSIIENGTNSFVYYLYKRWEQGRSEEALQAKTKTGQLIIVNQGEFHPTAYTSKLIREFVQRVGTSAY
jgi:hypothetical protein